MDSPDARATILPRSSATAAVERVPPPSIPKKYISLSVPIQSLFTPHYDRHFDSLQSLFAPRYDQHFDSLQFLFYASFQLTFSFRNHPVVTTIVISIRYNPAVWFVTDTLNLYSIFFNSFFNS